MRMGVDVLDTRMDRGAQMHRSFKAKTSRNSGFTTNTRHAQRSLLCIRCVMD
jgi:hypothetical protein